MARPQNFFKKYHYVYIITNIINGKQYVGDHTTDDLDDGYMGSGNLICEAYKRHGKENFKKEILEQFDSRSKAFKAQKKYIKMYNTLTPNGYNIHRNGGRNPLTIISSEEQLNEYLNSLKATKYSPTIGSSIKISSNNTDLFLENKENLQRKIKNLNDKGCYVGNKF